METFKGKAFPAAVTALALAILLAVPAAAGVDAAGHFSRAQTAWAEGDADTALAEYQAVINLLGDDAAARHNRAIIYLQTDRPADSKVEAERAVELAPGNGRFKITLAVVLMAQKNPDLDEARGHLLKAVEILVAEDDAAGLIQAYYNLGSLAQRKRQFVEARRWYRRALVVDPNDESTLTAMESLEGQKD